MALFPASGGGGLNSTSSWTDAVAKAKSYILLATTFTAPTSNIPFNVVFTIPKDLIVSADRADTQGYHYNNTSYGLFQLIYSLSTYSVSIYINESLITTHTEVFYYD